MAKLNLLLQDVPNQSFLEKILVDIIIYQSKNILELEEDICQNINQSIKNLKSLEIYNTNEEYIIGYSFPKKNYLSDNFSIEILGYVSNKFLIEPGIILGRFNIAWLKEFLESHKQLILEVISPKGALVNKTCINYLILDSLEEYIKTIIQIFQFTYTKYFKKEIDKNIKIVFEQNNNTIIRL